MLVAGPIERAWHLIPQFKTDRLITAAKIRSGLLLCASGFVKKLVVADNVAVIANYGFDNTSGSGAMHLIAIYAFAIQIYCDFSAYSDIAKGTARILGFEVFQNFDLPYLTTNPREFWRAWHISLSSWFRDYVYIPLGGNRGPRWLTLRNLAITMLLCGLWHGAAWGFVLWGAFHGGLFVLYDFWSRSRIGRWVSARNSAWAHAVKSLIFFQAVCVGWLLFRADSVSQAASMLHSIVFHFSVDATIVNVAMKLALFAVPMLLVQIYQRRFGLAPWDNWRADSQALTLVAASLVILLMGAPTGPSSSTSSFEHAVMRRLRLVLVSSLVLTACLTGAEIGRRALDGFQLLRLGLVPEPSGIDLTASNNRLTQGTAQDDYA